MDKSVRGNYLWHSKIPEKFYRTYDPALVEARWQAMLAYQAKAEQIKKLKEEAYQDGFLRGIFVSCLGYTLAPEPDSNLVRELKNEVGAKKADGAIVFGDEVRAVIELKDQKTRDLDEVEDQAFRYRRSHRGTRYVIISNFGELRFYIDDSVDFQRFDLFTLTREEFEFLHLCLCYESISSNLPLSVLDSAKLAEQNITAELYRKFAAFRAELFASARALNPAIAPARVLELVQKFLDRVIFVLFAEDKGLLPANTVLRINEQFETQTLTDFSLIQIWRKYFRAIDEGNAKLGIPLYNGGLFRYDPELDSDEFALPDDLLKDRIASLAAYDFVSDVGVNILGHIFEQSLSDLEELNAQIDGAPVAKNESKRKKDGVFYTPEFVTRFIVSHTLGELCAAQKSALNLDLAALTPPKNPRRLTKSEKETLCALKSYREYLLNLKILDPACGSGAFLIAALEWLIREHSSLDRARRAFEGEELGLYDVAPDILERNLYGVDINAGAVEVAKLSLWLRTARKGRALTSLSGKIKCANSLLDFPFDFKFDCVIGNPPYVRQELIKDQKPALSKAYETYCGTADLFVYFYELGLKSLCEGGYLGFICSNKFFRASYGENLRAYLLERARITAIADFNGAKVFEDATVDSAITILQKSAPDNSNLNAQITLYDSNLNISAQIPQSSFSKDGFILLDGAEAALKSKIENIGTPLKDWDINIYRGITTGLNDAFIIDETARNRILDACADENERERTSNLIKPVLRGRDIKRFAHEWAGLYLINFHNGYRVANGEQIPPLNIAEYPALKSWFDSFEPALSKRTDKGITACNLRNCAYLEEFEKEKISWQRVTTLPCFVLESDFYLLDSMAFLTINSKEIPPKYLLGLLNSNLIFWYFKQIGHLYSDTGFLVSNQYVECLPIPKITAENEKIAGEISNLSERLSGLNSNLNMTKKRFLDELELDKIPAKLASFWEFEFDEFAREFAKARKIKFETKLKEREFKDFWRELFERDKAAVSNLKSQIEAAQSELNSLVYALYDLTDDEIALIKNQI